MEVCLARTYSIGSASAAMHRLRARHHHHHCAACRRHPAKEQMDHGIRAPRMGEMHHPTTFNGGAASHGGGGTRM
jgi:hypothetical protein